LERLDESLAMLMMLLDIPMSDVLYIPGKLSGGYDGGHDPNHCVMIETSFVSSRVETYLKGQEW